MNNGHDRRKAHPLRRIARGAGLLRDPQSVRYRLGQISRVARLPRPRLDQRRHGLRGGQGRRRRRSRLRPQPPPRPRRSDRSAAQRRFRGRLRQRCGGRAGERAALHRRRRLGLFDRGLHRRPQGAPLRPGRGDRPIARRARRDRRQRRKSSAHRPLRGDSAPGGRPSRGVAPPRGLCARPAPTCFTRPW